MALAAFLVVTASVHQASAQSPRADDLWGPFQPLVGVWEGKGSGFGTVSDVSHRWEFVIGDRFPRLLTRSIAPTEDGSLEVHEDVGYVSNDTDRGVFILRQFLSEGYVNTFDVTVRGGDPAVIEFAYRETEGAGGIRARMWLTLLDADRYEMVLDLAGAGEGFVACQTMEMERVR
jgi:hypothetical protein